ncbi:MAG: adenylate/guanylate cyclase domain-containing protein, partial [Acidimicrobiia bacterium]
MNGERASGTATVLFTDLVGSTDLLASLGDATFDDLRRKHFALLREAVSRSGGQEVKTLGDGLLAVFGSAADAVACAVRIQQSVGQAAHRGPQLAIRVGLAVGDVGFEEGDVFGTPVVEAARLVAIAAGGQILATTVVRNVAGARTSARFVDLGPVELKGLPAPVEACEVAWEPSSGDGLPLPTLLTGPSRVFVGRAVEVARIRKLWEAAVEGERRVVLIGGEPGVGKTRLATELARTLHNEGAMVLAGRCDEDLGVPYQPFVEALRYFAGHLAGGDIGAHRPRRGRLRGAGGRVRGARRRALGRGARPQPARRGPPRPRPR